MKYKLIAVLITLGLLAPVAAHAQAATGELSITITDPSGAIVPGAEVTISGTDTGAVVRTLKTNEKGIAEVPLLQPGRYNTHVVAPGFKSYDRNEVNVSVGSVVSLDLPLELGESNDSVTVTGAASLIEDKSETIAQVIDSKLLTDVPLNGRNYLDAANFVPGVIPSTGSRDQTFSAYGNTGLQNAFLLDGARNVNYLRGLDNRRRDMIRPPLDALREFTVDTSNFSAEYGAAAGGVVNAITKSGTNRLHGSLYEFFRNNRLDARNYFATTGTKPLFVKNQYGGSFGWKLIRDKAWFFLAYEGLHSRGENTVTATVPTALERTGDFSQSGNIIYDPSTTTGTGSTATRTPFAGNKIPTLNPIGAALVNYYPLPNAGGSVYRRNSPERIDSKNGIARIDVQITSKDSIFARYAQSTQSTANEPALPSPAGNPGVATIPNKGIGAGYTRVITNTLLNEFRFSWATTGIISGGLNPRNEIITGSLDTRVVTGTPNFNISNITGIGSQGSCCGNSPLQKTSGVFDYADNVSWSHGKHQFKFGGEYLWIRPYTFATSNGRSSFGFTGVFTQNPQSRGNSGNPIADLLLGVAHTLQTGTVAENEERGIAYGIYAADQWQVTPALTINYGLRYEYTSPFTETQNRMGNFILDKSSPQYGKLIFAGDSSRPRSLIYADRNNLAPRIGFAYRAPGVKDLTIRGAYGIFYAQDMGTGVTNRLTSNPPFFGYGSVTTSSDQLYTSTGFTLSSSATIARPNPIPASSFVLSPTATTTLVSWDDHIPTSYVQQWSLSIQKMLPWNMLAEVNYVGNHGSHLIMVGQGNQPTVLNSTTVNSRRPLAAITIAPIKTITGANASNFEGLSAKLEKRYLHGVSFLNSLTYGHSFDLQNAAQDLCDGCGAGGTIQNNYNIPENYASSDNDVRFRNVLTGIFELPFGKNKAYVHNAIASAIIGGWAVSPVYAYQTGLPFTPAMSFDAANAGTITRPTQLCDGNQGGAGTVTQWFNTACYVNTASYTFGNTRRNVLRAPGKNTLNVSLQRNFPMHFLGETNLNLRAEAFNIFNHPQFDAPGATIGNALYGRISTAGDPRQIQLAARFTF